MELATAVLSLILPFIKQTLTPAASQMADDAGLKLKALYEKIRNRFRKGTYEGALLDGVEESPDDRDRQDAFARTLARHLETDAAFRESVTRLVESIQPTTDRSSITAQDAGAIAGGNIKIKTSAYVGHDVGHDFTINQASDH